MSKRPSFQFYPADWSANPNLKRCTFAEKGIWLEVMCLLHDQAEYGVLRWPLQEIAAAVKCRVADLNSLQRKGVMKGDDQALDDPFIYVPRSGRKDGAPVVLVAAQPGPIWFSSRMVKDEYVRGLRAEGGGGDSTKPAPEGPPETTPKPPFGAAFGPRRSSSSSPPSKEEDPYPELDLTTDPVVSAVGASPKGSRLKPDWRPSGDNLAFAIGEGFSEAQVERIVEDFRDFWTAKAGKDGAKLDWSATWRRWVRNTDKRIVARAVLPKRVGFV